jgi:DNA-binding transcriptional regulator/RsmH inhibitor MraZ
MSPDQEQKAVLQRLVGRHAIEVKLDSAGRITLPENLARAADITDDAVLAGNLYHFEIWSPARHKLVEVNDKKEELNVLKRVRSL